MQHNTLFVKVKTDFQIKKNQDKLKNYNLTPLDMYNMVRNGNTSGLTTQLFIFMLAGARTLMTITICWSPVKEVNI